MAPHYTRGASCGVCVREAWPPFIPVLALICEIIRTPPFGSHRDTFPRFFYLRITRNRGTAPLHRWECINRQVSLRFILPCRAMCSLRGHHFVPIFLRLISDFGARQTWLSIVYCAGNELAACLLRFDLPSKILAGWL